MKVNNIDELIFYTYYMIDWEKEEQKDSDDKCLQCGGAMKHVIATDGKVSYDGYVCHNCKRIVWVKVD